MCKKFIILTLICVLNIFWELKLNESYIIYLVWPSFLKKKLFICFFIKKHFNICLVVFNQNLKKMNHLWVVAEAITMWMKQKIETSPSKQRSFFFFLGDKITIVRLRKLTTTVRIWFDPCTGQLSSHTD